jgi:hypothetical protein
MTLSRVERNGDWQQERPNLSAKASIEPDEATSAGRSYEIFHIIR